MRVLAVVEASPSPLTGRDIANACGLTYKQAIDALNALYNYGRVHRQGRKLTARWSRVQPLPPVGDAHGTRNSYERLKCRCDICKAANAARHRERRAKLKSE
ncbi:MAG: hypothetical protein B7X50_10825 [Alishewanella sp. 34-51-39]|nr:MAG: hypothetical protein B7X50_10825 [Alishewanella sp. 34-51-39]